jgi:hypothetical protein
MAYCILKTRSVADHGRISTCLCRHIFLRKPVASVLLVGRAGARRCKDRAALLACVWRPGPESWVWDRHSEIRDKPTDPDPGYPGSGIPEGKRATERAERPSWARSRASRGGVRKGGGGGGGACRFSARPSTPRSTHRCTARTTRSSAAGSRPAATARWSSSGT